MAQRITSPDSGQQFVYCGLRVFYSSRFLASSLMNPVLLSRGQSALAGLIPRQRIVAQPLKRATQTEDTVNTEKSFFGHSVQLTERGLRWSCGGAPLLRCPLINRHKRQTSAMISHRALRPWQDCILLKPLTRKFGGG